MRKFLHPLLVFCLMCVSLAAFAEDYTMPKKDGFIEEKEVNGELTFYDMGGPDGDIKSSTAGYVRFVPANEGELLTISFDELDLGKTAKLYIYDGDAGFTSYWSSIKEGYLAVLSGNVAGQTFTATSGQLSVLYYEKNYSTSGTGWKATITSEVPKDMEYVSTNALTGFAAVNRGAKDQTIFGVDVVTDGLKNALTLNDLTIDCSALQNSTKVKNVRLYSGSISESNLLSTAANAGDNISAKDVTLKMKSNKFIVVADILPDASGEIPSLKIASVKVAGVARTPLSESGKAVPVNNVILMSSETTTYTISDDTQFYDDGGKDGTISVNFFGQVTFVPATEGYKVKIDFTKLNLFNTSSTRNDILKVYNGKEANEDKLIASLLNESDAKLIKSTSEDGALTVTLKSVTSYPKDGIEATVSQFLPGDMTFKNVSVNATTNEDVAVGETDAQLLTVNIVTDNMANPLKVSSFNLKVAENADAATMSKVKVYYLGQKDSFATTDLFGEVDLSNGKAVVNGDNELVEGNNYFAVVAKVADDITSGKIVGLTFESVNVAGTVQTPTEQVSATRTAKTVCHATQGSHSHILYENWIFTDTKDKNYPEKYELGDNDYITTFTPSQAGYVATLLFTNFDVNYDDNSWGKKAVFEIYSGNKVDPDKLIWKLSSNAEHNVGPGKKLQSDADDGAITIKFNPKSDSQYYAGTGWTAVVSLFKDHDMTIEDIEVTQTSVKDIGTTAKDEPLLGIKVTTEGSLTKQVLKGVKLNLKGSQESLAKVSVLTSGGENDITKATEFGSVTELGDGNITVNGNLTLRAENNYLWVKVDVADGAESGKTIDAKVVSLITDTEEKTVANGDPDGERMLKDMFVLKKGDNGVITVKKPLLLYDDGGPDGVITTNISSTITFVPGGEDEVITINSKDFGVGGCEFYVYSGREVNADKIIGNSPYKYYCSTEGPENLSSTAEDGSITIRFVTKSIEVDGFEVEVSSRKRTPFDVTKVESGAATTNNRILRGSADAEMLKVNVIVEGDKTPLSVDSFKFNIEGTTSVSDIANAKLYYTGASNGFIANNLVASTTKINGNEVVLAPTEALSLAEIGNHYFWLAFDINSNAEDGNKATAKLTSLDIGGAEVATDKVTSESASRTINKGFSGEYTIGTSADADYATFKDAIAALSEGLEGAVTFKVEDGTYNENISIANIEGITAEHPLKFISKSKNRNSVIIAGSGYSNTVSVKNTPYVTFEAMSFIPTSSPSSVVLVSDRSRHFTLKNCYAKASISTGNSGTYLVKSEAGKENGQNNDYMTIEDCSFDGGYMALSLGGTTTVAYTKERGLVVRNNTISDTGSKGIYVSAEDDALIEGNTVTSTKTTKNNYSAMDIYRCTGKLIIRNNYCLNTQSAYGQGIYLRESKGSDETPAMIYNNVISITNSASYGYAMYLSSHAKNVKILHNSINVKGKGGYAFAIADSKSNMALTNMVFENNLIQTSVSTGYAMYFNDESYLKNLSLSNNAYYFAEDGGLVKEYTTTLADYATLTGDATSIVEKADFVSDTDLHLKSVGNLQNGKPLSEVTTDISGTTRSTTKPTIGAYEYENIYMSTPEIAEGYPAVGNVTDTSIVVKTKWTVGGKLYSKLLKSTEDAPSAETLLKEKAVDCVENAEISTEYKDLQQQTGYKAYFLVESAFGVKSAVVSTEEITTKRTIPTLSVDLTAIYDMIESGASVKIEPSVEGGDAPYTYEWRNQMNEVIGTEATLSVTPNHTSEYRFTVSSADGQSVKAKTAVYVNGAMVNATFDDNYLASEAYWNGDDLGNNTFYSGSLSFSNYKAKDYWEGFSYANSKETSFMTLADQYRNITGGGADGSNNYAVVYSGGFYGNPTVEVTNNTDGETINGVYINNTSYAVSSMENGDGYATAFKTGDYLKVVFTGYDASNNSKKAEYYLADYTSANESDHYIVKDWKWVDLSMLGAVTKIELSVVGSQSGTPTYVALDSFGAKLPSGINDVEADGVTIYPVPTADVLHIDGVEYESIVRIYSISGQMVGDYRMSGGTIDVSALTSGVYVLQVNTANAIVKKQFVKM